MREYTEAAKPSMQPYHKTKHGQIVHGDSLEYMKGLKAKSVDLIVTSPPFGLVRKKDYGNVESHEYVDWFRPFGEEFKRIIKPSGSLEQVFINGFVSGCDFSRAVNRLN